MFKKVLQIVSALGLLLAGYAGYVRAFTIVARWFPPPTTYVVRHLPDHIIELETAKEATRLATMSFGSDHWSTKAPVRYYNSERGYWMYAAEYKRLKDGKRLEFKPFAFIWRSRDGRTLKTLTADIAETDFDQPVDLIKPAAKSGHVIHAQIRGNVRLRDDRGTPLDPSDDMEIGPLTYIDFDEPTLQIRTDSPVFIRDRDLQASAIGMLIELRPQEGPHRTGFNGAKTAWLQKNVHILAKNVGRSGILPGTAKGGDANTPTPLDLQCAGPMKVVLPEPQPPAQEGQPPPKPNPTLVWFYKNVRAVRGIEQPDQLDSDVLFLTLVPAPKPAAAADVSPWIDSPTTMTASANGLPSDSASTSGEAAQGPLTELVLKRAEATGHAVWLQSEAQAVKVRGNQLIHEKFGSSEPDKTYFRGDTNTSLLVEKIEYDTDGPDPTKIRFIDSIRSIDVTIFENVQSGGPATVLARGPGLLETRAERGGPVVRTAAWQDRLEIKMKGQGDEARRVITLVGNPKVSDDDSGTLTADTWIKAWLKPNAKAEGSVASPPGGSLTGSSGDTFQIERMEALDNVHLVRGSDVVYAEDQLNVEFEAPPPTTQAAPSVTTSVASPAPEPGSTPPAEPGPEEAKPQETAPAKPAARVQAKRVWARVLQQPGEKGKGEIKEARLRGSVVIHQDPAPDKTTGTDVTGDAADLISQSEGRSWFEVHGRPDQPAEFASEELKQLLAQEIIIVDQAANKARVVGPGTLTMMVNKGLLNESELDEDRNAEISPAKERQSSDADAAAKAQPVKVPFTITWRSKMTFLGQTSDLQGSTVAKAEFFTDVVAQTEDARIICENLEAFMDKPVSFTRLPSDPKQSQQTEAEPKAQIAFVRCTSLPPLQVVVTNIKRDPETRKLLEKQQIEGQYVTYDKLTGQFEARKPGLVHLYSRKGEDAAVNLPKPKTSSMGAAAGSPTRAAGGNPTRAPGGSQTRTAAGSRTRSNDVAAAASKGKAERRPKSAQPKSATPAQTTAKPLELTRIRFSKEMRGRFGSGANSSASAPRQADFYGDVEVLHGPVNNESEDLDADSPPLDSVFLTSKFLRVTSDPPTPGSKDTARNWLNAVGNAAASNRSESGEESAIQGDQITYDSSKKLFYIYGYDGHDVQIAQATGPGQPPSTGSGKSAMYNLETGQFRMEAPKNFRMFDSLKTGSRARDINPPDPNAKPPKPPRRDPRLPPRSDKERRGFGLH